MQHPRLPAALSLDRLRLNVHLGEHAPERGTMQAIEVSIKIYFKNMPAACRDDCGQFLCYGKLSEAIENVVHGREYRLIEFLACKIYDVMRTHIIASFGDEQSQDIYVWLRLHKCNPPIPQLLGGASFEYTDVPSGLL